MKIKLPEDGLAALKPEEIEALLAAATEEASPLYAKDDSDLTDEEANDLIELADAIEQIRAQVDVNKQAAAERAEKLAAARGKVAEATAPAEVNEPVDQVEEVDDEPTLDVEIPDDASELVEIEEKEAVTASAAPAGKKRSVVRSAAGKAPSVEDTVPVSAPTVITAAASLPGIESRSQFSDMGHVAQVWSEAIAKGPAAGPQDLSDLRPVQRLSSKHARHGFAKIKKSESEFAIDKGMTVDQQLAVIEAAASERNRFGSRGLAAAGSWCAPSETMYDFVKYETVSGILDIPTVTIRHGGINFTKGPDYSTLAATWGFLQTEAQAEAGTTKDMYDVECPPFAEVRMDAIGFGITAGVLTASPGGYPELIRRVLEIGVVAHAHKVNAQVISRISTLIGTAVNWSELGSTVSDILDSVELQIMRLRYTLAMAPTETIEAVFPLWAVSLIRADVGRRLNIDNPLNVTDQMVNAWFALRGARVQWVYDYQPLTTAAVGTGAGTANWTSMPNTLEYMLYPAGSYIKGTSPVLDLDTIYDSVGLSTNTYTAAFFEEGLLVAERGAKGVKVALTGLTTLGAGTGFPTAGAGEGVTFAPAAP